METRMRQLGTPQHPSSQTSPYYWGTAPREFWTPQHPSTMGSISRYRPEAGFSTPQHPGIGKNYWGTLDGKRQFGTPLRQSGTPPAPLFGTGGGISLTPDHRDHQWGTPERGRQFGTPQHPGGSFREFRAPQHPSQGTNNWGGASPMLARNIPQESLDLRYERLQAQGGVAFAAPVEEGEEYEYDHDHGFSPYRYEPTAFTPNPYPNVNLNPNLNATRGRRRGLLWKLIKREPREEDPRVVGKKKRKWFPMLRMQKRWPTGW